MRAPINRKAYEEYVTDHYKSFPTGRIKPASYKQWAKIRKLAEAPLQSS